MDLCHDFQWSILLPSQSDSEAQFVFLFLFCNCQGDRRVSMSAAGAVNEPLIWRTVLMSEMPTWWMGPILNRGQKKKDKTKKPTRKKKNSVITKQVKVWEVVVLKLYKLPTQPFHSKCFHPHVFLWWSFCFLSVFIQYTESITDPFSLYLFKKWKGLFSADFKHISHQRWPFEHWRHRKWQNAYVCVCLSMCTMCTNTT